MVTAESPSTLRLQYDTPAEWTRTVLADFNRFLRDHAAAEKKAAGMAVSMISHYPDRRELVTAMSELAVEEMSHFREVIKWLHGRGGQLGSDEKDPYIVQFRKSIRRGADLYLLDQLLIGGIIEARGHERFGLIAQALPESGLKNFYRAITQSEGRHFEVFVDLAYLYLPEQQVAERLQDLLAVEADIVATLPIRAALH